MNYIKCFSRSRSAKNCRPFFVFAPVWCPRWHQARSIATDAHLRPSGVPLVSGKEYCHGCTFAPVWCPRWHQARSIATDAHLRPSGVPLASGKEYCHGCTFAPVLVPHSIILYTLWYISDIRALSVVPTPGSSL